MSLKEGCCRALVQTEEQFEAVLGTGRAELIYLDAGVFMPERYEALCLRAREKGADLGLACPIIFRKQAELFFDKYLGLISRAGFDALLIRSLENLMYLKEKGFFDESPSDKGPKLILDHNIYSFNSMTPKAIAELCGMEGFTLTLPLELSGAELSGLSANTGPAFNKEIVVYGHAPMMVSAQCVHSTNKGCDRRPVTEYIEDRTRRRLPVKNCCTFCYNIIYNSVPTVIYDLRDGLLDIDHQFERYEFTVEDAKKTAEIFSGQYHFKENDHTRGRFRKGTL